MNAEFTELGPEVHRELVAAVDFRSNRGDFLGHELLQGLAQQGDVVAEVELHAGDVDHAHGRVLQVWQPVITRGLSLGKFRSVYSGFCILQGASPVGRRCGLAASRMPSSMHCASCTLAVDVGEQLSEVVQLLPQRLATFVQDRGGSASVAAPCPPGVSYMSSRSLISSRLNPSRLPRRSSLRRALSRFGELHAGAASGAAAPRPDQSPRPHRTGSPAP